NAAAAGDVGVHGVLDEVEGEGAAEGITQAAGRRAHHDVDVLGPFRGAEGDRAAGRGDPGPLHVRRDGVLDVVDADRGVGGAAATRHAQRAGPGADLRGIAGHDVHIAGGLDQLAVGDVGIDVHADEVERDGAGAAHAAAATTHGGGGGDADD